MKLNLVMLAAMSAAGLVACGGDTAPAIPAIPEGTTVTVALLETTDIHANVMSYNYYSLAEDTSLGLERTSSLVKAARAENPNNLLLDGTNQESPVVAPEFVGTGLSSTGDGRDDNIDAIYSAFPNVKYHVRKSGYVACEVTPKQWRTDYRIMDYVSRPGAPLLTPAKFVVPANHHQLERA